MRSVGRACSWAWSSASLGIGLPAAAATHRPGPLAAIGQSLLLLVVCTPALVAAGMSYRASRVEGLRRLLAPLGRWRVPVRWYLVALLLPVAVNALALIIHVVGGGAPRYPGEPAPEQQVVPLVALPLVLVVFSLVEELGWRGYALPRLQRGVSALTASLIIGLIWTVWYIPLGMTPDSTQGQIPHGWYLASTLAISVVLTWLFNSTDGSLVPVVLLHACVPAANIILPVLPSAAGDARVYAISSALYVFAALVIVAVHGPRHLAAGNGPPPGGTRTCHVRDDEPSQRRNRRRAQRTLA